MVMRVLAGLLGLGAIFIGLFELIIIEESFWYRISTISMIFTGICFGMYALRGNKWFTYFNRLNLFILKIIKRYTDNVNKGHGC